MASHFSGPLLEKEKREKWSSKLPIDINMDYIKFVDDFITDSTDDSVDTWTVVKDTGASVAPEADELGGAANLQSAATTDDDGASIQLTDEMFSLVSGKRTWFKARFKVADADQQDVFVGLCENFATNPEACLTSSNRYGFQINDGGASILCKTEASDTETSTDSNVDAADDTYVVVAGYYNGSTCEFYVNDDLVATHSTNIPTANLTFAFMSVSGDASGTKKLVADYVAVVQER